MTSLRAEAVGPTLSRALLFGHLLGVLVFLAAVVVYLTLLERLRRARSVEELRGVLTDLRRGDQAAVVGVLLLVGAGFALAVRLRDLSATWLLVSVALLVALAGVGRATADGRVARLREVLPDLPDGAVPARIRTAAADPVMLAGVRTMLVLLVEITFLMTTQPGWPGISVSLVATAVGCVLAGRQAVPGRGARGPALVTGPPRAIRDVPAPRPAGARLPSRPVGGPGIEAAGLRKEFSGVSVLAGLDLAVPAGTVLSLLGPNGAGKTTAVRILTTALRPDGGSARVAGHDLLGNPAGVRSAIGLSGQTVSLDGFLSGRENLEQMARLCGLPRAAARTRAAELLELFDLTEAAGRQVHSYSGGMARKLDLAASLAGRPAVLFLDEPTAGLDPRARTELLRMVRELVDQGTTVLLTTQYLAEADYLADSIVVLDHGRVIARGTADDLKGRVGRDRLLLRVADRADVAGAAAAVADLAVGPAQVDLPAGEVTLAIADASVVASVVRRLDAYGVVLADLQLRRPTLDDVFLALTGPAAERQLTGAGTAGAASPSSAAAT